MAPTAAAPRTNQQWLTDLRTAGPARDAALSDLRRLLVAGLQRGLARRGGGSGGGRGGLHFQIHSQIEDFVQEALVKILDRLDSFRDRSRFTTWAHKIAIHVALTELRRKRWQDVSLDALLVPPPGARAREFADPQAGPARISGRKQALALVQHYLERHLSPRQRQALVAVALYGMPLEEVARRMGSNRNALYKLLHDARKRLKQRMIADGLTPERVLALFD